MTTIHLFDVFVEYLGQGQGDLKDFSRRVESILLPRVELCAVGVRSPLGWVAEQMGPPGPLGSSLNVGVAPESSAETELQTSS